MRQSKTWAYKNHSVNFPVPSDRLQGVTLFGAIGNCLTTSAMMTARSTNKEDFNLFLDQVIGRIRPGVQKPYLILDNHRSHYAIIVRERLDREFNVIFIPTYR